MKKVRRGRAAAANATDETYQQLLVRGGVKAGAREVKPFVAGGDLRQRVMPIVSTLRPLRRGVGIVSIQHIHKI